MLKVQLAWDNDLLSKMLHLGVRIVENNDEVGHFTLGKPMGLLYLHVAPSLVHNDINTSFINLLKQSGRTTKHKIMGRPKPTFHTENPLSSKKFSWA